MMSKTNFRILLSLLIAVILLGAFSNKLFPSDIVGDTSNQVIEFNSSIPNFDFLYFLYGNLIIALMLVSFVGIFFFKAWARDVFLTALIMTIPGYFVDYFMTISPPVTLSGVAELLGSFALILSGFLIAVMYLTPVKEFFFEKTIEQPHVA